jgi:hypothetical protein
MKKLLIALLFTFVSTGAYADGHSPCGVTNGTINVLANEFTTLRIVMEEAENVLDLMLILVFTSFS